VEAVEIIAEPNRRAILSLLVSAQHSVGEIERQLRMSQPTVSKHLRVLPEAGFVESTVDAQRRLYRLKPKPFQEVDAWLAQFRRFWSGYVDALERLLSTNMWALAAVTEVLIAYPMARFVIPAVLQAVVPDVVRTVLNLI
jgi:DNA-binding transcriptional ArsR family regulator